MVLDHLNLLMPIQDRWQSAFDMALREYGIDSTDNIPNSLQTKSLNDVQRRKSNKVVLGFCGPGATGKETVAKSLGAPKVINTTSRPARSYEVDGVHYRFVDEPTFHAKRENQDFLFSHEKAGRGWYGVQKNDLESVLSTSPFAVIEESPAALFTLSGVIRDEHPQTSFLGVYLLPPDPVLAHLAYRLAKRCLDAGDPYEPVVLSTLGPRQVEEFESTIRLRRDGMPLIYVVNDDVSQAVSRIRSVL